METLYTTFGDLFTSCFKVYLHYAVVFMGNNPIRPTDVDLGWQVRSGILQEEVLCTLARNEWM